MRKAQTVRGVLMKTQFRRLGAAAEAENPQREAEGVGGM